MVAELMAAAGARFADLERIAVTVGPGSFTGLRVGLAFAKGLSLATDRAVFGVSTLAALAEEVDDQVRVAAVDAGRGRAWAQAFGAEHAEGPRNIGVGEAGGWLGALGSPLTIVGPGARLLAEHAPLAEVVERPAPAPEWVARLGAAADAPAAAPLYLRPPDAMPKPLAGGVRPADLSEAERLAGLHALAFADAWSAEAIAALMSAGAFALVTIDGRGFVLVRPAADEAEILALAVAQDARRRGQGRRLLLAASDQAARLGAGALFLEVGAGNAAALALYRSAGFAQIGRRSGYYAGGEDALVLRRTLNTGAGRGYAPAAPE